MLTGYSSSVALEYLVRLYQLYRLRYAGAIGVFVLATMRDGCGGICCFISALVVR